MTEYNQSQTEGYKNWIRGRKEAILAGKFGADFTEEAAIRLDAEG